MIDVKRNGKKIKNEDTFKVVCLNTMDYMAPFIEKESTVFVHDKNLVKFDLIKYIKEGGRFAEPEKYITLKEVDN